MDAQINLQISASNLTNIDTPVSEWVRLTEDPSGDALALYDAGEFILLVRENEDGEPVEVLDFGRTVTATPEWDREAVEDRIENAYPALDAEARDALFARYEETIVADLIRMDIYDPDFPTTFVDGVAYIEGLDRDALVDEVSSAIGYDNPSVASDIAAQVNDWWTPSDSEAEFIGDEMAYSARIALSE